MAIESQADDAFSKEVVRRRDEYMHRRLTVKLYSDSGPKTLDVDYKLGDKPCMIYWNDDGTENGQCVRIFDVPGTLSGDILRLHQELPSRSDHFEVDGDSVRPLHHCLERPADLDDDSEDVSDLVSELPLVSVDAAKHFLKKCKYRSEIENLIRCQGGSVPGHPLSPHVIQLLGRSSDGQLVFEKLSSRGPFLHRFSSLAVYKSWILQLIDGLDCLHSVGIVHRDLRIDNIVFSKDGERLVICDLEGRWGQRWAPEIVFDGGVEDSGWTPKSDIYDIGHCIQCMVYANVPINPFVEWPVPPPLQVIVDACERARPEERPTLADLRVMASEIQT